MTGIDISGTQNGVPPGSWEFVVVKLSEANWMPNHQVDAQWAAAKAYPARGFYHYARPAMSDGVTQGAYFAQQAHARGFRPGIDLWQLDAEDGENAGVGTWPQFIDEFMGYCLHQMGSRGFLYAGWPFVQAHGLGARISTYKWWLPAYGPNDGQVHPYPPGTPAQLVVIHQFTSAGNLDQNRIVDRAKYNPTPAPPVVKVQPRFNPPLTDVVDAYENALGSWLLQADGGVFTDEGQYHGTMVGNPNWVGRRAARLVKPGTIVPGANAPLPSAVYQGAVYEVIATSGERYVPVPPT